MARCVETLGKPEDLSSVPRPCSRRSYPLDTTFTRMCIHTHTHTPLAFPEVKKMTMAISKEAFIDTQGLC